VARGVGLPQAFQNGARCLQDVVSPTQVPEYPRDGRHAKVHQDLGDVPHQDRQSPGLGDVLHHALHKAPLKVDELHQLLMVVQGIETLGLRLHQHRVAQVQVPLSSIELDLLLPQHLVKAEGGLGVGGVHIHLVEVLFLSSLDLGSLGVKVGANLHQGFLRKFGFLLPCGEGLLPPCQLLLPRQKLLLQLFSRCHCCGRR
jgi:hypothetical protein